MYDNGGDDIRRRPFGFTTVGSELWKLRTWMLLLQDTARFIVVTCRSYRSRLTTKLQNKLVKMRLTNC